MNQKIALKKDAIIWIGIMCLAAIIAFTLLKRDSQRHFGAVSYGAFPDHDFKSQVSVAILLGPQTGSMVLEQAYDVQRMTATGKRKMNVISYNDAPKNIETAFKHAGAQRDTQVLLIDQNTIIRGVYDLSSPDDFRQFRLDVTHLL